MKASDTPAASRGPRSRGRFSGASSNQNPSAADARIGPNRRLAASVTATARANAAQGNTVRAERQETLLHCDTVVCALSTTLSNIAPIMRAAMTAT